MKMSRRSLLAGVAAVPLAGTRSRVPARRSATSGSRVIGVSPANDVSWVDAVSLEPLIGPRLQLPGWWALGVSWDRRRVLLRSYASTPFLLATADTRHFDQSKPFHEGVSSVKGAALAWPHEHRLMIAKDEAYGSPHGLTRVEIVDPTSGKVAARKNIAAHLAGATSGQRGLLLALSPNQGDSHGPRLALVDWSARVHSLPLAARSIDTTSDGHEPSATVALSPDEQTALVGSSHGRMLVNLANGHARSVIDPGDPITQITWLDARHALLVTQHSALVLRLALLDLQTGTRRVIGESSSIPATGPSRVAFTPPEGGITTITANGRRLSHHVDKTPLSMLYPQAPGRYAMAVPGSVGLRPGRRIVVDLRTGALALDKSYIHRPQPSHALANTDPRQQREATWTMMHEW